MKRVMTYLCLAVLCFALLGLSPANAHENKAAMKAFSENLAANLLSPNPGVRQSAMQLIAKYGDQLTLDKATVFELVRVYRWNKNLKYRQMALVTLHRIQDKWAMEFLKTSLRFEDDPVLKRTIAAIVQDYESKQATL